MQPKIHSLSCLLGFGLCFWCGSLMAQEAVPQPAELPAGEAAAAAPETTPSDNTPQVTVVDEMVQYLEELSQDIARQDGDCAMMTKALSDWHDKHEAWIAALDYATVNADARTIEKLRTMSEQLGKQLSVCYNSKRIAVLLMKYSGY